jgi:hypothetical protein
VTCSKSIVITAGINLLISLSLSFVVAVGDAVLIATGAVRWGDQQPQRAAITNDD